MDAARAVVELFEAGTEEEARRLAAQLDMRNRERQTVQGEIIKRAFAELAVSPDLTSHSHVAVIAGEGWHRGVIGIAASKVAEKLNRPCVIISFDEDGIGHGSARSIDAYHLLNGLTECADLFVQFGGHSHAAGLTIKRECIEELRRRLNQHAASNLQQDDLLPVIQLDAELPAEAITFTLVEELRRLEPFGAANPQPIFRTRDLRIASEPRVLKERHLKMRVSGGDGRTFDAIWWGGAEELTSGQTIRTGTRIEMAYTLELNTWQGETRLQMCVQDIKASK
jgi:single-stranded-DNA-specific exonuclease